MTIPSNINDANSLEFNKNDVQGQINLRYTDAEMKEGEIGSRQFVTLIDVIGEGVIAGFPSAIDAGHTQGTSDYNTTSLKDVFLNNVQVLQQSASNTAPTDNDFNFGTSDSNRPRFIPRFGTSTQTKIPGVKETERDNPVGVPVTTTSPQVVSINDTNTDGLRVTIGFPKIQKIEDDGNVSGTTVEYNIEVKDQAGGTLKKIIPSVSDGDTLASNTTTGALVTGKSTSTYFKDHIIFLPDDIQNSDFPLTVTVTRITADSTDFKLIDAFELTSVTELVFEQATYPNTAVAALRFDAEIFRSVPKRMYRVRGRKIAIPHNATVRTDGSLSFSGTFNGSLKTDGSGNIEKVYCNDPAWILYDIITESEAGFGDFVTEDQVDKYAFYNASVYNSELINNNQGSTSPRFSCNIVIQTSTEAYTLLDRIASIMRASLFLEDGKITLIQDRPTTSSYFFSYANVTEDGFVYTNASKATRDTVINVKYFENETRTYEYITVEDTTANQNKFGVAIKNIEAVGCSDQAQARRMGLWHLYTQNNETETVAFTTTADAGSLIRPGNIITVQDPVRSGLRRSGRIKAVNTNKDEITVDNIKDLPTTPSTGDELSVILTDGTLETQTISTISGSVITVSSAYSSAPQVNSVWLFVRATTETEDFRVLSVKEDNNKYTISAMFHNPAKYAFVEDGATITTPVIKNLIELKDAPSNIAGEERIIVLANRAVSKLIVSWQPVAGVSQYSVKHKFNNGSFQTTIVQSPVFEIFDSELGTYEFEVYSYNAFFEPSVEPTTLTFDAVGKTALPGDVKNLQIEPISDKFVRLRFDQSTDVDVVHGGTVVIRGSNVGTGEAKFSDSTEVEKEVSGNVTEAIVPNIGDQGEYILKFKDDGGRLSAGDTSVIFTSPETFTKLNVHTDREDNDSPPFQGVKNDCFFSTGRSSLVLGSLELLDDVTDFDSILNLDILGNVDTTGGFYLFANSLDLGSKHPLNLRRHFVSEGFYAQSTIDTRRGNINTWTDFDGADSSAVDVDAKLLVATTDDDPDTAISAQYLMSAAKTKITKSSHGLKAGDLVFITFTSGFAQNKNIDHDFIIDSLDSVDPTNAFAIVTPDSIGNIISQSGDCTISNKFTPFNTFVNGTFSARGFKFKCELETKDPAQSIAMKQLGYIAEMDTRTETSLGNAGVVTNKSYINSGLSTKSVAFTKSFFTAKLDANGDIDDANRFKPSVGITIENAQAGDFFTLSNITGSGFDIDIKNGSSHVARNFKFTATGFGRGS